MESSVSTNVSGRHIASIFRAEDAGVIFFPNFGIHLPVHTASELGTKSTYSLP
jgi:hypothetical protein